MLVISRDHTLLLIDNTLWNDISAQFGYHNNNYIKKKKIYLAILILFISHLKYILVTWELNKYNITKFKSYCTVHHK